MKKSVNLVGLILLLALFSSSCHSEVYVAGHDYSESDIRLTPHDLYVIPPYNITFNFSGMEEFKVDGFPSGPHIVTTSNGDGSPRRSVWSDDTTFIHMETPNLTKSISFQIERNFEMIGLQDLTTDRYRCEQSKTEIKLGLKDPIYAACFTKELKDFTLTVSQSKSDLAQPNRPIPRNGNYHVEGILKTTQPLNTEIVRIDFHNVTMVTVGQFIISLHIAGVGKKETGKIESWKDYVARMRQPNDYNGYAPSISALKFIDTLYNERTYYDPKTGSLAKQEYQRIPGTAEFAYTTPKPLNTTEIESLAIENHYGGPIPLPKNVSVASPNGE